MRGVFGGAVQLIASERTRCHLWTGAANWRMVEFLGINGASGLFQRLHALAVDNRGGDAGRHFPQPSDISASSCTLSIGEVRLVFCWKADDTPVRGRPEVALT